MEVKITVIKGENFLDYGNRPLNTGYLLNTGSTVDRFVWWRKLGGSQIRARANSAMSRIGAVVNKMMQINGKVIIINYFVVLLDVL